MASACNHWHGTATDLLGELACLAGESVSRSRGWPKSANALSGQLRRIAPNLRRAGVEVVFDRGTDSGRARTIRLEATGQSAPPQNTVRDRPDRPNSKEDAGFIDQGPDDPGRPPDDPRTVQTPPVGAEEPAPRTAPDGPDDLLPDSTGPSGDGYQEGEI
jgi:hypothetical protein